MLPPAPLPPVTNPVYDRSVQTVWVGSVPALSSIMLTRPAM